MLHTTGTVECFCPLLEKPGFSDELQQNNLCFYDYTIKGKYITVAYGSTGGNIPHWMRSEKEAWKKHSWDPVNLQKIYLLGLGATYKTFSFIFTISLWWFEIMIPNKIKIARIRSKRKGPLFKNSKRKESFFMFRPELK